MRLPTPRGPLSDHVVRALTGAPGASRAPRAGAAAEHTQAPELPHDLDNLADEDLHLALWCLYELHYRGFDGVDPDLEWDPALIALRNEWEQAFERELRARTSEHVSAALEGSDDVPTQIFGVIDSIDGPRLAAHLHRHATHEEMLDFLRQRSLYHLKESDPHSFVLARIDGRAKVALAEIQYDEYGAGRPHRLHSRLFGDALEGAGLDRSYGAYVDQTSGATLAVNNLMSLFGLRRRLRGAAMGHLAAFESTSSVPCRKIVGGLERLDFPPVVAAYFDEHVEADAAHEQVAVRDLCGGLVADEPELREDVVFGAAACVLMDAVAAEALLGSWQADRERAARDVADREQADRERAERDKESAA